jgi:hypothetical protein
MAWSLYINDDITIVGVGVILFIPLLGGIFFFVIICQTRSQARSTNLFRVESFEINFLGGITMSSCQHHIWTIGMTYSAAISWLTYWCAY